MRRLGPIALQLHSPCVFLDLHLFFTAMIFVFAIFVLISLGENQLCFRVFVYAMTFITSPFFHIDHLDLGAFVEVQFTGHSTMLKMFDIIFSDFQKVYYQPMGKKCWGNTWKSMFCKYCLGNTCQLQRAGGWVYQKSEKSSETRCGDARVLRRIIYMRSKKF